MQGMFLFLIKEKYNRTYTTDR